VLLVKILEQWEVLAVIIVQLVDTVIPVGLINASHVLLVVASRVIQPSQLLINVSNVQLGDTRRQKGKRRVLHALLELILISLANCCVMLVYLAYMPRPLVWSIVFHVRLAPLPPLMDRIFALHVLSDHMPSIKDNPAVTLVPLVDMLKPLEKASVLNAYLVIMHRIPECSVVL